MTQRDVNDMVWVKLEGERGVMMIIMMMMMTMIMIVAIEDGHHHNVDTMTTDVISIGICSQ